MADGRTTLDTGKTPVLTQRSLVALGFGTAAFILLSLSIATWYRATTDLPDIAVMAEKLDDYAAAPDGYDIVFLGSSQTFRHIDPAIVEDTIAACGLDRTVYNFGVPALREPEMRYIAASLLEAPHPPQAVIVQNPIRAETAFTNMMSARGRFFRGGPYLGDAVQDVQCYTGTRAGQARSLLNTLRAALAEGFGLGRLAETFVPTDPPAPPQYNPGYRDQAGFFPVDADGSDHIVQRLETSPVTPAILDQGRRGQGHVPSDGVAACRAAQLTETLDAFRQAGIETAYFVSPAPLDVAHDRPITEAVAALNPGMAVIDFNAAGTVDRYFEPGLWFDAAHMNGEGARRLSRDVGTALCQAFTPAAEE